jgi:hypothetical protein
MISSSNTQFFESVGTACAEYQDKAICNVPAKRVQVDEIWSFVGAKQKNVKPHHFDNGGYAGDVWPHNGVAIRTFKIPKY